MPPYTDKFASVAGVVPIDIQAEVPPRKERTIFPVSWDVLVTLAIPGALHANVPNDVLVNADGSTSQYGTMRVTAAFSVTKPTEALVVDTIPSLALFNAVVA